MRRKATTTTTDWLTRPWTALWLSGQRLGRRLWPDREAVWRFVAPLAFSLGVHALAGIAIVIVAIVLTSPTAPAGGDVLISFDAPEVTEQSNEPTAEEVSNLPEVGVLLSGAGEPPPALPELTGLSTESPVELPELRSGGAGSVGEVMSELRRREPDVSIGATFAGLGARRASRVVYVVDASGAMVTSFGLVVDELERSIARLGESQRVQVVLYRDPNREGEPVVEAYGVEDGRRLRLQRATALGKARMSAWLRSMRPTGRSNPLDGLRAAMEMEPDVIFLLARSIPRSGGEDGAGVWGLGLEQTLAELERLNPVNERTGRRPTVIKTIQFLEDDPTGVMPAIGRLHGDGEGSYRVITLEDLRRP